MNSSRKFKIFIIDDDETSLENLSLSFGTDKYEVTATGNSEEALQILKNNTFDIAILDLKLQGTTGIDIIEEVKDDNELTKFVLITGYSEEEAFLRATRIGVSDILKKPYDEYQLLSTVERLIHVKTLEEENIAFKEKLQKENKSLKKIISSKFQDDQNIMIGSSPKLNEALNKADLVAEHSLDALIVGETGTGKELLAQYIQRNGARKDAPFIIVNSPALSDALFESELFGYEKGAFTGALEARAGLFEVADGGILFLDEITEIPIHLQATLLRVIQEGKIKRVGGTKEIEIDVQVLSATNRNVHEAVRDGSLRQDLFHRIASIVINLPPLRERKEDLEALAKHFQNMYAKLFAKEITPLSDETMEYIYNNEWSGNIREFASFIKNYTLFGTIVKAKSYQKKVSVNKNMNMFHFTNCTFQELEEAKYWLIDKVMKKFDGNKTLAAKHLGVSYQGLAYLLKNISK